MEFKGFPDFSSGDHLVYRSETVLNILLGSHLGNISLKSESNWPKGLVGGVKEISPGV